MSIAAVIGGVVQLRGRGAKQRGKCPFHGSKSDSLAVDDDAGFARCWGCGWPEGGSGDVIRFVQDYYGLDFRGAVDKLEAQHGLAGLSASPVVRAKRAPPRHRHEIVDSMTMAWRLLALSKRDDDRVGAYLAARGVPAFVLTPARLSQLRFAREVPIVPWKAGGRWQSVETAPAIVAPVLKAPIGQDASAIDWQPMGVHATFLAPDGLSKMARQRADGSDYPARKMLGHSAGGVVPLGRYGRGVTMFVGEGIETVLSGMALAGASDDAIGLAMLSLGNLQGAAQLVTRKTGARGSVAALPLYDVRPDPARARAVAFAHDAPVTVLVDADMKPLRGIRRDQGRGDFAGIPVIEWRGGPVVRRAISTAERADICASLAVLAWRAEGVAARAVRPRMGCDFNDVTGAME